MKDYDKENTSDPTFYLNEVTINSGFMPYYQFIDSLSPEQDTEA
ncbi:hypothetical protein [Desulfotruncus alcoholivorax]|nr:hypothetical protein [Desulfotruncus alcoholivorax]